MSAADRVEEFLGVWDRPGGLRDAEVIYSVNEVDLRLDDLRALIAAYRVVHPTGTPTADHRIMAERLAGERDDPPIPASEFVTTLAYALDEAHASGRREDSEEVLAPLHALFAGDPDTPCRTTWREVPGIVGGERARIECVEVPLDELRAAFDEAERVIEDRA